MTEEEKEQRKQERLKYCKIYDGRDNVPDSYFESKKFENFPWAFFVWEAEQRFVKGVGNEEFEAERAKRYLETGWQKFAPNLSPILGAYFLRYLEHGSDYLLDELEPFYVNKFLPAYFALTKK